MFTTNMGWANDIIYMYNDEGASQSSVAHFKKAIVDTRAPYIVKDINAEEVIMGDWRSDAACLVIPGGADLPYCKRLNGKGNEQIRDYVENGGTYIGFCAGGYYAGKFCDFDRGGSLEVLGSRELAFFPGAVRGPVLCDYVYDSDEGARLARVLGVDADHSGEEYNVYFNGGGHFVDAKTYSNVSVLYQYNNPTFEGLAAVIECSVGKGKAILSGFHPEYDAESLKTEIDKQVPGWKNLEDNIVPGLLDRSHLNVFKAIISKI
jgi:biotin--protein ligase